MDDVQIGGGDEGDSGRSGAGGSGAGGCGNKRERCRPMQSARGGWGYVEAWKSASSLQKLNLTSRRTFESLFTHVSVMRRISA